MPLQIETLQRTLVEHEREIRQLKVLMQNVTGGGTRTTQATGVLQPANGGTGTTGDIKGSVTKWLNSSGSSRTLGTVVVENGDRTFGVTTSVGDRLVIGIVSDAASVAVGSEAHIRHGGYQASVKVQGAVVAGDYLRSSATAERAETAGTTKSAGVFAIALTAFAGPGAGTVSAFLMGGDTVEAGAGGGAHTFLSATHSDSVAQTVSRGSIPYGNATPAWDELLIGAANRVLWSDGTDVSWSAAPRLANIADTGGTNRITLSTVAPEIQLTGGVRIDDNLAVNTVLVTTQPGQTIIRVDGSQTAGTTFTDFAITHQVTMTTTNISAVTVMGVAGTSTVSGITVTTLTGLSFTPNASMSSGAVITTFNGFTSGGQPTGTGTVTTMRAFNAAQIPGASITITTLVGYDYTEPTASPTITTQIGVRIGTITKGTNRRPFQDEGATAGDAHGNRFRSNTMIGSLTGSFGSGDGVLGLANATTNPSANPTAACLLYSTGGAFAIRTDGGGVHVFEDDFIEYGLTRSANPTDPATGKWHLFVIDLGATQFLRCRYNDAGTMRVGDLALV